MHFVALSSIQMYSPVDGTLIPVRFRHDLTIGSLVIVVFLCWVGLYIGSLDKVFTKDKNDAVQRFIKDARNMSIEEIRKIKSVKVLVLGSLFHSLGSLITAGVITATGVCIMHYIGMQAMVFDGRIEWNKGIVAASVLIAIVAATAAFWILFRLLSFFPRLEILRLACSVIAAIAVNGMHYCGQAAATITYVPNYAEKYSQYATSDQSTATAGALVASAILLFGVLILSIADLRVWYYNSTAIIRELDMRSTILAADPATANERFLHEFKMLRDIDGSARSIADFQLKLKKSRNSDSYTGSESATKASVVLADGIESAVDSAAHAAAAAAFDVEGGSPSSLMSVKQKPENN